MDLRNKAKDRRRRQILEAARSTIIIGGLDALSMRALAESAEVSVATLYNLYGGKERILFALLLDSMDGLDARLRGLALSDPIERARAIIEVSIEGFVAEGALFRPVMGTIEQLVRTSDKARVINRSQAMLAGAIVESVELGQLVAHVPPRLVARQIFVSYVQAVRYWADGHLSDEGFGAQATTNLYLYLLGLATDETRPRLIAEVEALRPVMERIASGEDLLRVRKGSSDEA